MVQIGLSAISSCVVGVLVCSLGFIAMRNKKESLPAWIPLSSLFAGIFVVLCSFWSGCEQSKSTNEINRRGQQILNLSSQNVALASQLVDWTTGSGSICFYGTTNNRVRKVLVHYGEWPVYDLTATTIDCTALVDLAANEGITFASMKDTRHTVQLGTVTPNHLAQNMYSKKLHFSDDFIPVNIRQGILRQEFSIRFSARGGMWVQDVILQLVNERYLVAYRVRTIDPAAVIYKKVDEGFPQGADGDAAW